MLKQTIVQIKMNATNCSLILQQTNSLNNNILLIGQRQVDQSDSSLMGGILLISPNYSDLNVKGSYFTKLRLREFS